MTVQAQESGSDKPRLIATAGSRPSEFSLTYDEILIGSGPGNDLVIQDATVSRHHARLVRDANGYRLTDFETINGTFVNGERITGTVAIAYGDELGFGTARYTLRDTSPNRGLADSGRTNGVAAETPAEVSPPPAAEDLAAPPAVENEAAYGFPASEDLDHQAAEPAITEEKPRAAQEEPGTAQAKPVQDQPDTARQEPRVNGDATIKQSTPQSREWRPETPPPVSRRRMRPLVVGGIVAALFAAAFVLTRYTLRRFPLHETEKPLNLATKSGTTTAPGASSATAAASPALPSPSAAAASASASPHASPRPRHPAIAAAPMPAETAEEASVWLLPLNRYRGVAHLLFVDADPAMTAGARDHARYLVKNYGKQLRQGLNLGALAHREDPANPWYTAAGSAAAAASDTHFALGPVSFRPASRSWAFDSWMTAPFHRLWILNPRLRRVGYGEFCERGVCSAVLEVRSPATLSQAPAALPYPIEFPPNGSIVRMTSSQGEWPNPLASCPGYSAPSGLPLTLQLGQLAQTQFSGYTLTLNGTVPAAIEACGFNASSYHNPDPVAERQAQTTLRNVGAIVLIPHSPLVPGNYTASITAAGQQYTWSFTVSP
ncbi:MAG TPA: FHA domain-containing protein [Candidatus Binataceae bacterium]|nr:FHA domain-containing protein [Candidatus Binataceae bacterium]